MPSSPSDLRAGTNSGQRGASLAALAAACCTLLAACGTTRVGPHYDTPTEARIKQPEAQAPLQQSHATDAHGQSLYSTAPLPAHWWRLFNDPQLDAYVQDALTHNTDLRVASANLQKVKAAEVQAKAATRPEIHLGGSPNYGHPSGLSLLSPGYKPPNDGYYGASLGVSYDLDVVGQVDRAIEAAGANIEAADAARDAVRVSVAAGTARAYAEACSTAWRIRAADHSIKLQQDAVALTKRLQQAGRVGAMDTARAQAELQQLLATRPPMEAGKQSALYRLATLTGRFPEEAGKLQLACTAPPSVTQKIPVGDGAALLRRRPDIRQAERQLAAATANIGVAMGDLYPKISLGLSASSVGYLNGIGHADTLSWSLGPLISWRVPNTGAVQAKIAQAQATTQAQLAHFDGLVLNALRETETALLVYAKELDRHDRLSAAQHEAAQVAEQARRLYIGGKVAFLASLDANRSLANAEAALAASEAQLADDQVQVFLALGGGWEP